MNNKAGPANALLAYGVARGFALRLTKVRAFHGLWGSPVQVTMATELYRVTMA